MEEVGACSRLACEFFYGLVRHTRDAESHNRTKTEDQRDRCRVKAVASFELTSSSLWGVATDPMAAASWRLGLRLTAIALRHGLILAVANLAFHVPRKKVYLAANALAMDGPE